MTQQVKTLCSYLLNSHQLCKKILFKLSYLKAFFIQKAIIFTKKLKTCMQNAVFTLNAYDHLFLMSVNGKNDVIKGPVLPSVLRLANQICLDKIFWQNLILRANNCWFY